MKARDWIIVGLAAAGVYALLRQSDGAIGWWQSLPGMVPGSKQSGMLMEQEGDFWKTSYVTGSREQPGMVWV